VRLTDRRLYSQDRGGPEAGLTRQESIAVTTESPVIEAASATTRTALTQETPEFIPTSRNGVFRAYGNFLGA